MPSCVSLLSFKYKERKANSIAQKKKRILKSQGKSVKIRENLLCDGCSSSSRVLDGLCALQQTKRQKVTPSKCIHFLKKTLKQKA